MEKLASGLRINRAGDDAAGLAISEKMRAQIRGLNQASRNAQDGISFLQTAEGYLNQTTMILQRLRELAVQSATGTYTNEDRYQIKVEVEQLVNEVDRIASQAEFNTLRMLKGGFRKPGWQPFKDMAGGLTTDQGGGQPTTVGAQPPTPFPNLANTELDGDVHDVHYKPSDGADNANAGGLYVHVGPNMDQRIKVYIQNNSAIALGLRDAASITDFKLDDDISLLTLDGANRAIHKLDASLFYVNRQRADIGGFQNRLEGVIKTVDYAAENLQSAESQIRDVDVAKEMVDFVKNQILSQSTAAMLTQANARPQLVMRILG
jgi:flagellin